MTDNKSMFDYIEVNPKKVSGTPVFRGTRIPVSILFDYLEDGQSVEDFLAAYDDTPMSDTVYGYLHALRKDYIF